MLIYKNLDANRFLFISEGLWVNKKKPKKNLLIIIWGKTQEVLSEKDVKQRSEAIVPTSTIKLFIVASAANLDLRPLFSRAAPLPSIFPVR